VYGPVRTVVWEGSGRKARPYPDPGAERSAAPGSETSKKYATLKGSNRLMPKTFSRIIIQGKRNINVRIGNSARCV